MRNANQSKAPNYGTCERRRKAHNLFGSYFLTEEYKNFDYAYKHTHAHVKPRGSADVSLAD